MAFGVEELRVLRRALDLALHPRTASAEDVQDCLRLTESLDEAMREGARLRAFLLADLARYRAALPGTAVGYVALLSEALSAGHRPGRDDLAALGALRGNAAAAALLDRCRALAGPAVSAPRGARPAGAALPPVRTLPAAMAVPASRSPFRALPGGRTGALGAQAGDSGKGPAKKPAPKPAERPAPAPAPPAPAPAPGTPQPARRPIPTPGEVFPRRKPAPPSERPQQHLAAV
ncbi:hypothetical protein ABZT08_22455 [Streptomyces sp. NPDC005526]|uniref:hypothetical protein n=1 Tax=Streptomyces sp. NPDC005526 TaxID=3156885 RepID=UPI0033A65B57